MGVVVESSGPKNAKRWRIALITVALVLFLVTCGLIGPPVASQVVWFAADSIAVQTGAMPADAHVYADPSQDWSEFPRHVFIRGDWHTCDRMDEFLVGYYVVDLVSRRVVDSYSENWDEEPEPAVSWTDLVSVDATGRATFDATITGMETGDSLPRLIVTVDGTSADEIVVTVPWDTAVATGAGSPMGCAEFITWLDGALPVPVEIEVESVGGNPWTIRIAVRE